MKRRSAIGEERCWARGVSVVMCLLPVALLWPGTRGSPFSSVSSLLAAEDARRGQDAASEEARKADRKKLLDQMREHADAAEVYRLDSPGKTIVKRLPEALIRYSDPPRRIVDATMWAWGGPGRPLAIGKVECLDRPGHPRWFYCLASLCEGLAAAQWRSGPRWSAKEPGLQLRQLPDGPQAAATPSVRLLQMKEIIRRFSVTLFDPPINVREEVRLLPRPLHHYADPGSRLQDGAIFAFATNGTNPDSLIVIELYGKELPQAAWKYAPVRMTVAQLSVHLDQKEVWSVPYVHAPRPGTLAAFDTWLFFFETIQGTGE